MGLMSWIRSRDTKSDNIRRRLRSPFSPFMGSYTLETSEAVFAAISRISTTFGALPCMLYKGFEPAHGDPLCNLVKYSPNANMTAFEFFRTLEVDRNTDGNGYALIVPSMTGGVQSLDILDPGRVAPMIEADSGELWYQLLLPVEGPGAVVYVHNTQMIHVRHISTDGIRGIDPLKVLKNTLDYAKKIEQFSLDALEYGVHAGIVLDFPAEMSEEKRRKSVNEFMRVYKESKGQLLALDAGVRATRMDSQIVDAKLLDMDRITRSRVASVYNMPPHMLGDYSNSSYSGMEQENLEFLTLTIEPIIAQYRQEFNRKLLTQARQNREYSFGWDKSSMLQADSVSRSEYYSKMIRSAGITPNEMRAKEGRPPEPGGDELYVSRDLVSLRQLPDISTPVSRRAESNTGRGAPDEMELGDEQRRE